MTKEKTITLRIDADTHRDVKVRIAHADVSLKDYVLNLIRQDLASQNQAQGATGSHATK